MKIGVLETGAPPRALQGTFGRYGDMFQSLLGKDAYSWRIYDIQAGGLPQQPEECDAYLVTGSAAGVYDPAPWIGETAEFLRAAKGKAALVGVCFGHQLMAQAFGGKAIKSPKGWGIGLHDYRLAGRQPGLQQARDVSSPASHQDQVVEAPPGAVVVGGSEFTPMGMLAYQDQPAISIQLHPEFDPAYAKALIEARKEDGRYREGQAEAALTSLDRPNGRDKVAAWITAFLAEAKQRL